MPGRGRRGDAVTPSISDLGAAVAHVESHGAVLSQDEAGRFRDHITAAHDPLVRLVERELGKPLSRREQLVADLEQISADFRPRPRQPNPGAATLVDYCARMTHSVPPWMPGVHRIEEAF